MQKKNQIIQIRNFHQDDWLEVQKIYQAGIDTQNATFQEKAKEWEEWDQSTLKQCRLVATEGERVIGWAALSPVSKRRVYAGVAETSIYIAAAHRGRGIGRQLLAHLVTESENEGFWTLQAVIFPENIASIELHKGCGFQVVGRREKLGKMGDRWRDVILLERRSKKVGV